MADPRLALLKSTKNTAGIRGLDHDLTLADIVIPAMCPVLGVALVYTGKLHDFCPVVDRKDPRRGYVKDNIWVISNRANRWKNEMTLADLKNLYEVVRDNV